MGTLYEVKQFFSKNFEIKDMDETSYVIGIRSIEKDLEAFWICLKRSISIKVFERFRMKNC